MIHFAHGPWWSEWHHLNVLIYGIPGAMVAWYWLKNRFRRK